MIFLLPAVLKCKVAQEYVGGPEVWKELMTHYSDKLPIFRRTQRGDSYYRRETIDRVCQLAEIEGKLIFDPDKVGKLPPNKKSRHLTRPPEG